MNCANCGAPMRLDENRNCYECDHCQTLSFPDKNEDGVRVFGEPSTLVCPVCAIALVEAALDDTRILYCNRCRGMLIRMSVFAELIEDLRGEGQPVMRPRPVDPKELERRTLCPQCHQPMLTHFYGGGGHVVMDDCPQCGLNWLDSGELMRIVRSQDRAGQGGGGSRDDSSSGEIGN